MSELRESILRKHLFLTYLEIASITALLSLTILGTSVSLADPYYNSSEPGCNGSDPSVIWCDDFEDGDWLYTFADVNNQQNDGWNGTPFSSQTDPEGTHFGRCGGRGAAGTNCAAGSGPFGGVGQAVAMGDHNFVGQQSYDEIYFRYYIKKLPGFLAGGQKHITFNMCCAGVGGIKFANLTSGGSGPDVLPPSGNGSHTEAMLIPFEDTNRQANISSWQWTSGVWYYVEVHIKLNTPGVANGIYELWLDNCGATGTSCPPSSTLRAQHTNVSFRGAGDNSKIGSIWLENWANPASAGEEYYDQIKVATKRVGPMNGTQDQTPPSAPTNLTIR